ncbi:hypothetical protein CXB51_022362 [Gossypium anomalum]|uniref:Importin subunit alpha n=1 Tax=Gossypium anomalum TaxID=47600 RepID=A0A8J6CST2_9ROSI|nr:hypothetical protein CXB51_022362 [Gossypium anomalum]
MPLRPSNTRKDVEMVKKQEGEEKDNLVVIRKSKREDSLLKKGRMGSLLSITLECVPLMVKGVSSDNPGLQLEATTLFRKLLSVGIVPRLVEFLDNHDQPQLQFEAAWALTNIASGTSEHNMVVIQNGAVPKFVQLLCSSIADVREQWSNSDPYLFDESQAVWALGNIAVLNHGGLIPLLAQLNQHSKLSLLRNATWALLNFCRGKPPAPFHQVKPALQVLHRLIESSDEEILTDACWALSYISDGMSEKIQAVIEAGICPRLVELLHHPSEAVVVPALRTIGNIVTGLPCLYNFCPKITKRLSRKRLVGQFQILQLEIEPNTERSCLGYFQCYLHRLPMNRFSMSLPSLYLFNDLCWLCREPYRFKMKQGCMKPLCDLLACSDPRIVTLCLEGLDNILKIGEADKTLSNNECDGLEKIENLQSHENNEIYNKAVHMLERYWLEEKEEEEEDHFW